MSILDYAKQVLRVEADAVAKQIDRCGAAFEAAVQSVLAMDERGRFVISGMGKPGFVAQKISATLASTGTPSLFLHPAEAIHGDVGRLTAHDVVLLISNSGETEEITRLLDALKKVGVRIIAMTGNSQSTLARHADVVLDIGNLAEACPMGLAPSATTTAMLALGDALALCILKQRDFGPEDYALNHPGGALGRKLMKVRELMRTGNRLVKAAASQTVRDVMLQVTKSRSGCAVICDAQGRIEGIFTDGDLRRHLESGGGMLDKPIREYMTRNPVTVAEDSLCGEAVKLMRDRKIDELPVVDAGGRCAGVLDVQDLLGVGLV